MNWDQVEGAWKQYRGKAMSKWGKLTNDDIETINGKRIELLGMIQSRYGRTREEAELEIDKWTEQLK